MVKVWGGGAGAKGRQRVVSTPLRATHSIRSRRRPMATMPLLGTRVPFPQAGRRTQSWKGGAATKEHGPTHRASISSRAGRAGGGGCPRGSPKPGLAYSLSEVAVSSLIFPSP